MSEGDNALRNLSRLEQTLSNTVQFSAQKGLLAADLDAELDRLYRDNVEPARYERVFYRLPVELKFPCALRKPSIYAKSWRGRPSRVKWRWT